MNFNSLIFLILFLPIFICAFYLVKNKYRYIVLLATSLIFYAYSGIFNFCVLLIVTVINYLFALILEKNKNKILLILSILIDIASLSFFKYNKSFVLPLGMSFYIFNNLTYIIDVYNNKIVSEKNILFYFIYACLFSHITMGPILHYDVIRSKVEDLEFDINNVGIGLRRFIFGLIKKVLIADNLGILYSALIEDSSSSLVLIFEIIVYGLQLYIDFSSYSDMAIGLGKLMGFDYPENFNYPYLANTVSDFWRRWHMSLTNFFKEYVYIPLGGNRVGKFRHILNILIVWALTGIWHGSTYNFLLWGLYYGLILILEKYLLNGFLNKIPGVFRHAYVLLIVFIGYIFFSFSSIQEIGNYINNLFTLPFISSNFLFYLRQNIVLFIVAIILCFKLENKFKDNKTFTVVLDVLLVFLYVLAISYIISGTFTPFLYSAF